MLNWFRKFLNFFGIYTKECVDEQLLSLKGQYECEKEHKDSAIAACHNVTSKYAMLKKEHSSLKSMYEIQYDENILLQQQVTTLTAQLQMATGKLEEEKNRNKVYQNAYKEHNEYRAKLEEQLSEILHADPTYGFPRMLKCMPGATTICSQLLADNTDEHIKVVGRTLATEDLTHLIKDTPDMLSRMEHMFSFMEKYGILNRIARELIRTGTVALALAYNKTENAYELYYDLTVRRQDLNALVTVSDMKDSDGAEG